MLPDSFGNLTKLQHIDLSQCQKLTISSETLGKITTLKYLNLSGCKNIKVLPPQLTHQPFLQEMILVSDFKELPSAIGNLSNLKILTLESSCLEMLPPSFGDLRSLEKLKLSYCSSLKCFPDSIRMLPQLKSLSIRGIKNLEKFEMKECPSREVTFKKVGGEVETATDSRGRQVLSKLDASKAVFPNLQHLKIGYCDQLVEIGALPTTLQTLYIYECTKLEELPSMGTLVSLEVFSINGKHWYLWR
jgi:Leucine-rich repeat (LRR) protein